MQALCLWKGFFVVVVSSGGIQEFSTYLCRIYYAWLKIIKAFVSRAD